MRKCRSFDSVSLLLITLLLGLFSFLRGIQRKGAEDSVKNISYVALAGQIDC